MCEGVHFCVEGGGFSCKRDRNFEDGFAQVVSADSISGALGTFRAVGEYDQFGGISESVEEENVVVGYEGSSFLLRARGGIECEAFEKRGAFGSECVGSVVGMKGFGSFRVGENGV